MSALVNGLATMGVVATELQQQLWLQYLELLHKWNTAYNLTAVRDPEVMLSRHLFDSLSISPHITGQTILDVGAGAGLPSIPLAILWPDREIQAVDSNGKKVRFMQLAASALGLVNFSAVQTRVERWLPGRQFDGITCRAFASLADTVKWSEHLLSPEGVFWAMKGRVDPDELSALPKPFMVSACLPLQIPSEQAARHLLVIRRNPCL